MGVYLHQFVYLLVVDHQFVNILIIKCEFISPSFPLAPLPRPHPLQLQKQLQPNFQKQKYSFPMSAPSQNHFTFQIKNPGSTKNKTNPNMVAMKRIENYSYAMSDEIGLGFTSHVYRGRCELTNLEVAVKVIELKNNQDQLHANFLKEEVAVLETIKDADPKNLLKLEKVIKSKNNLYIITEFCEGNDVAKILRKKKLFSQIEAQSIMKQVLNGYKQLYRLKIVHRDLKLANLFITKGNVKIADFGFAIGQQQCKIKMDYNVGSPYYMPPQSLRQNEYSYLSDVWAMGVIAYQLVYGKVPWKDKDDEVLFQMIMNCPVDRLFEPDKEISEHYKKFIRACLTIDKRFRATPEFIINYPWPMAKEYVDGLEEPNQFRQSMGGRSSLPRMSLERPELKKVASDNTSHQLMRKRTPSVDNLRNIVRVENQSPMISQMPPRSQNVISKSFIQQPIVVYNDGSRQRGSIARSSQAKIPPPPEPISNSTEIACIGQLHFCRFMMELFKILHKSGTKSDSLSRVTSELAMKIGEKMRMLVKMAQSQDNVLKCGGFAGYIRTERWQGLRQMIYKYDMKFRDETMLYPTPTSNPNDNTPLIQAIKDLKTGLSATNLKLAELLTYYYQLKEEDGKTAPEELEERVKISYIVDQCKCYAEGGWAGAKNQGELQERRDRLLRKLALLGL